MPLDICNKCKNATATNASSTSSPPSDHSFTPGDTGTNMGTTKKLPKVSAENAKMIAEVNSLDMELYEFAKALFRLKTGACFADKN